MDETVRSEDRFSEDRFSDIFSMDVQQPYQSLSYLLTGGDHPEPQLWHTTHYNVIEDIIVLVYNTILEYNITTRSDMTALQEPGYYRLTVASNGTPLRGSPFSILVPVLAFRF